MTDYTMLLERLRAVQADVVLGANHKYRADGDYRPGVTTVIKTMAAPALTRWMVKQQAVGTARAAYRFPPLENEPEEGFIARMERLAAVEMEHARVSKAAADVGTQVHALIQHQIEIMLGMQTPAVVVSEEALFRYSGWREWALKVKLKPLAAEARVYNAQEGYAGTIDALAVIGGRLTVLDWKSSKGLYDERRLQSAAYRKALESMGWPDMDGAIVVVREGEDIRMLQLDAIGPELDSAYEAFVSLLKAYRWQAAVASRERAARK